MVVATNKQLRMALSKAVVELCAIRNSGGSGTRGPTYFNELVEECFAALQAANDEQAHRKGGG